MLRNRIYFGLKPFVPLALRLAARRRIISRLRPKVADRWPILPGSERPPEGWPGWPDGRQFAFVLTHDVESERGLQRVRALAELEMKHGFRSSFNFIPDGSYEVPSELRHWLVENGFEVGVHDLYHNGKLFRNREAFRRNAERINQYLTDWQAVGFRSGFMLNRLDWMHDLDVAYDASTFDTDPFEPQPDGVNTIFPFWLPKPAGTNGTSRSGYMELPYTLPQDSTLYSILREQTIAIWKLKLEWIAGHGGMALLNTHPDYMDFAGGARSGQEYPVSHYREFLEFVRSSYGTACWHATPREVAGYAKPFLSKPASLPLNGTARNGATKKVTRPKIWIDLDNTPHVPFFEPIMEELAERGYPLLVTARDAFQVCELADKKGLNYIKVGRHHGKNRAMKAAGLIVRSMELAPVVLREKPVLGVSHGARSQLLLGNWLRIPTLLIEDYEFCQFPFMMRPSWVMAPAVIPDRSLPLKNGHIRKYEGIKEDVYAWKLDPDPRLLSELGLAASELIVTVRPPATEAHYHNPESELLFERFMDRASRTPNLRIVLLPRNHKQGELIRSSWPGWFEGRKTVIPNGAVDGLNLLWHSDLVVSGGGTMNREAAALGVPVYSIFRGTIGAVDRNLSAERRLILIESVEDVERKIALEKRARLSVDEVTSKITLQRVVDTIVEIAEASRR